MPSIGLERLSCLVIDPHRHMRMVMRSVLNALGIRNIREAEDGGEGYKALQYFPADFAITEYQMMPLDGVEFTRLVRMTPDSPNPYLPIIMCTAYTEKTVVMQSRDAGITEFLAKPFSAMGLRSRIHSVVLKPRQFVRTLTFFGPDRRRHPYKARDRERRAAVIARMSSIGPLSQEEVSVLMDEEHPSTLSSFLDE